MNRMHPRKSVIISSKLTPPKESVNYKLGWRLRRHRSGVPAFNSEAIQRTGGGVLACAGTRGQRQEGGEKLSEV